MICPGSINLKSPTFVFLISSWISDWRSYHCWKQIIKDAKDFILYVYFIYRAFWPYILFFIILHYLHITWDCLCLHQFVVSSCQHTRSFHQGSQQHRYPRVGPNLHHCHLLQWNTTKYVLFDSIFYSRYWKQANAPFHCWICRCSCCMSHPCRWRETRSTCKDPLH